MIALLDTPQDLEECAAEMRGDVGQLLSPLTRRLLRDDVPFGVDNGRFAQWNKDQFLSQLERNHQHVERCLFVNVPDVVGSARRTLEVFERWRPRLKGWPLALACQDGQEHLPVPWDHIAAVFIGGSTNWKCSHHATHIIQAAQALDKWVHVGRVNTPERWKHFDELGVNSADGTGIARYSHMRRNIADRDNQHAMEWPT